MPGPCPPKELYQDDPTLYRDLLDELVKDWALVENEGIQVPGYGKMYPIVLGNKGDWSYLASCLHECGSAALSPKHFGFITNSGVLRCRWSQLGWKDHTDERQKGKMPQKARTQKSLLVFAIYAWLEPVGTIGKT